MMLRFVRHKMLSLDHASAMLVLLRFLHIFQIAFEQHFFWKLPQLVNTDAVYKTTYICGKGESSTFIQPESDHWLPLSLTDLLTHFLMLVLLMFGRDIETEVW